MCNYRRNLLSMIERTNLCNYFRNYFSFVWIVPNQFHLWTFLQRLRWSLINLNYSSPATNPTNNHGIIFPCVEKQSFLHAKLWRVNSEQAHGAFLGKWNASFVASFFFLKIEIFSWYLIFQIIIALEIRSKKMYTKKKKILFFSLIDHRVNPSTRKTTTPFIPLSGSRSILRQCYWSASKL